MDYSNLFYQINGNKKANDKLNRINEFRSLIKDINDDSNISSDKLGKINQLIDSCNDCSDYITLILDLPVSEDGLITKLCIFRLLIDKLLPNYCCGKNYCENIRNHFREFEKLISNNKILITDDKVDKIITELGESIATLDRVDKGQTIDYVYYLSPKTIYSINTMNEAQSNVDYDFIVKSQSDPKGSLTSVEIDHEINPSEYLINIINESDHDYFIHKIKVLYDYIVGLNMSYDDIHTKAFIDTVNFIFSKVIDDITGKEILLDTLDKCDKLLSDVVPTDPESSNNIDLMIQCIENITEKINEHPEGSTSLLDEFGLGYIYDILPKDNSYIETNIDNIVSYLNECSEDYDMISVLSESIKESVKENIDRRKKRKEKERKFNEKVKDEKYKLHDDTYDTRLDIERRRLNDEYDDTHEYNKRESDDKYNLKQQKRQDKYDFKHQKKLDKYDDTHEYNKRESDDKYDLKQQKRQDKYDLKQQKRQDKYDFKHQKKLDKYDEKKNIKEETRRNREDDRQRKIENAELRRQERNEARQRRRDETKIGINRWKTLELTNDNVRKATNALRKAVKTGAVAGTAALAGINPIFAGSSYLISSYVKDKRNPANERKKYIDELQLQITELDNKIDQADRQGENDKKIALIKMKQKLESTLKRCGYKENSEYDM